MTISVIVCAHNEDAGNRSRWRLELQRHLRGMHPADIAHVPVFRALDDVPEAARAFERYDLVSAPVVDDRGKLVGRLTVEAVMDLLREEAELRALRSAGLSNDEDLFAAPWASSPLCPP